MEKEAKKKNSVKQKERKIKKKTGLPVNNKETKENKPAVQQAKKPRVAQQLGFVIKNGRRKKNR